MRISIITTSRAEYGHLYWLIRTIAEHPDCALDLVVAGAHQSPEFGQTIREIQKDGFAIGACLSALPETDTRADMAHFSGQLIQELTTHWHTCRPDWVVVIADRYEMLAPAVAATCLGLPIAHIEGGDVSGGALDDHVRNALSKLAHLHFAPSQRCAERLIAMGEASWRVHHVGALSLERLVREDLPSTETLETALGFQLPKQFLLAAMHPVTLAEDVTADFDALLAALAQRPEPVIFCYPNADCGHRYIREKIVILCRNHPERYRAVVNLPHLYFVKLMDKATALIGNSSAGIMESPAVGVPCLNIGDRQLGRETGDNTLTVPATPEAILDGIEAITSIDFQARARACTNPYAPPTGQGYSSERIVQTLLTTPIDLRLLRKFP